MTITEAVKAFSNKYPGMLVTGYWRNGADYILDTKVSKVNQGITIPGQYVVKSDGSVYGTNPMRNDLRLENRISMNGR